MIPHLGGGGAEQVVALLAQGLSRSKYEVHLGLVTESCMDETDVPAGVAVHMLGARRVRMAAYRVLRLVRQLRPDVVLSGMAHLNFLILLLRPLFPAGTRVLVRQNATVSSSLAEGRLPAYTGLLYRLLYRQADGVICQSGAMAEDLALVTGLDRSRIAVAPNPLDLEGIRAAFRGSSLWPGPGPNLLAVGRLSPEKGYDLLLEAVATVRDRFPALRLTLLGKGAEEQSLRHLAASLGLDGVVEFAGYQRRPYLYFPGATLFVMSSRHEGMPNALLEALAAGLPVVSTPASGGVVALLAGRPQAWLAESATVPALAAALEKALTSR